MVYFLLSGINSVRGGVLLGLCMWLIAGGEIHAASKKSKAKNAAALKGVWKGSAEYKKSGMGYAGKKVAWNVTLGKGDGSQAAGTMVLKIAKIGFNKVDLKKGAVVFTIMYSGTYAGYPTRAMGTINRAHTTIIGTFSNKLGSGEFRMKKEIAHPPKDKLKGQWAGRVTGKKGKIKKEEGLLSIDCGAGDIATATAQLLPNAYAVKSIELAQWNEALREIQFVFICTKIGQPKKKKKKKKAVAFFFTGIFNEEFTALSGSFDGNKLGGGEFTLSMKNASDKPDDGAE